MQIQLGIDRRAIASYAPTPMSLVGQVIQYFDTYLGGEFNESDSSIAQLITVAYLEFHKMFYRTKKNYSFRSFRGDQSSLWKASFWGRKF